jgi:hypothetical protein
MMLLKSLSSLIKEINILKMDKLWLTAKNRKWFNYKQLW